VVFLGLCVVSKFHHMLEHRPMIVFLNNYFKNKVLQNESFLTKHVNDKAPNAWLIDSIIFFS
jgi:hypothetical protein